MQATLFALALLTNAVADEPRAKAIAPENHVQIKDTASGSYYVAKPLKQEYDRLLGRLKILQADIDAERTSGAEALRNLKALQTDLTRLRDEIEKKKTFVPVAKTHTQTETTTFDFGNERLLVITADKVRIVGWAGPGVKIELEKTVLSADDKLSEAEMKAIKVVHQHGRAKEKVGRSRAENDAEEAAFLKTPDGQALTPENRQWRQKIRQENQAHHSIYRDFQGKDVDALELAGLTHQQGNRQMTLEVNSQGGDGSQRSVWRRHARLTVYLPPCQAVAVRGCREKLEIENVTGAVVLTDDDSHTRDYHSESHVRGVTGSLTARNVPLHAIADVTGDVSLTCTVDLANVGTSHDAGSAPGQLLRTHHYYRAQSCAVKNVGGFRAWVLRTDLDVQDVAGKIDIRNEFGQTRLQLTKPLAVGPHRVVSEAGRIELDFAAALLGELPLWAVTQCGNVRTNAPRELLDSFHFTQGLAADGVSRNWSGLRRPKNAEAKFDFEATSRPDQAWHGQERPAGLDLISRGGTVVVTAK